MLTRRIYIQWASRNLKGVSEARSTKFHPLQSDRDETIFGETFPWETVGV